jgi:hypothetical protein
MRDTQMCSYSFSCQAYVDNAPYGAPFAQTIEINDFNKAYEAAEFFTTVEFSIEHGFSPDDMITAVLGRH